MIGNIFNTVAMRKRPSNIFDLSHDVKLSFKMGQLIPTCVVDVLPGDKFKIGVENMYRFAPLVSPVMHKVYATTHFFYVPNRILWPEWQDWIVGETDVAPPTISTPEAAIEGSLADYLGYPQGMIGGATTADEFSALPVAAYAKIWDEYYRDQNLQNEIFSTLLTGDNVANYGSILYANPQRKAWMHDYFTSCLPFAQKGDAVELPLLQNDTAPVQYITGLGLASTQKVRRASDDVLRPSVPALGSDAASDLNEGGVGLDLKLDITDTHEVNVSGEAATINTLRRAFRLQEWLEKNARGGTRYIENILAHWDVKSSDKRLQRPEYIGGAKQNMVISEVLSTAQTEPMSGEVPIGQMAGHGISVGGNGPFEYRAEEHGWIIGITAVCPRTAYQQGVPRMFSRKDKLDYAWPTFAHIGEQEVLNKELYVGALTADQLNGVFGYIPRYSEYRYMNSRVAGKMKSELSFWHLGRIFNSLPSLNGDFVECDPSNRIFAVTDEGDDEIFAHVFNNIKAIRKLPKFGVPTI